MLKPTDLALRWPCHDGEGAYMKGLSSCSAMRTGLVAFTVAISSTISISNAEGRSILDDVISTKVLKVGTYADDAPWSSYDSNNQLVGFDIDVVNMLAADLKAKVEWSVLPNSAARISALQ